MAGDYTAPVIRIRWPLLAALILAGAAAIPADLFLSHQGIAFGDNLGGDPKRELEFLQQYGGFSSLVIVALVIVLLDPRRRIHIANGALAMVLTSLSCHAAKILIGRPRPKHEDPYGFVSVVAAYPTDEGPVRSWEVSRRVASELWSMPSSHAAAAAALSVFLVSLYPRLTPLCVALCLCVGLARWITGAHYVSDVLIGTALGILAASIAIKGQWGAGAAMNLIHNRRLDGSVIRPRRKKAE